MYIHETVSILYETEALAPVEIMTHYTDSTGETPYTGKACVAVRHVGPYSPVSSNVSKLSNF
jgi:hypothetical protein